MKNNRAPGPHGILAEMIEYGGDLLMKQVTRLINLWLTQNRIPQG